eukprot:SAG22_NODE_1401_length_4497_cov_101.460891_5_plen_43_part_00
MYTQITQTQIKMTYNSNQILQSEFLKWANWPIKIRPNRNKSP